MTSLSSNRINQIVGNSYDQSGNQLTVNGNTLADKFVNHVVSDTHGALQALETYVYDGRRSRVEKYQPGRTPRDVFVYDMGRLAAGYNSMATMPPFTTCYLSDDHLGTPRLITDSHGLAAARHDYLPFGEELAASTFGRNQTYGPGSDGLEHFTGKERDSESGLDYFGARYYGSNMGRFMNPDWNETPVPIPYGNLGDPQTLNLYAYVGNNPLSRTDPTGDAGKDQKLTNKSTIRVDAASADQVNVHVKTNSGEFRGRLNPDTKQIEWTKGAPPKQIAEAAQQYVLSKGKYDIAAAKKEMSVLGGTREGEEGIGGKLGESTNLALAIMNIVDIVAQSAQMAKIISLEGTTGFHMQIDGSLAVTNLQKFGDTFGVGAGVKVDGDTFKLNSSGNWVDQQGSTLTQDKNGGWHIQGPQA